MNRDQALQYAERGWRVLPAKGKRPLIKNWTNLATTDFDKIREWCNQWPDASVGIATGKGSGLYVLDVDGERGKESLYKLSPGFRTYTVQTGGGGVHYYFQTDKTFKSTVGFLPGLDIRADRAFVVAPPSVHEETGQPYKVLDDIDPAPVPGWLLEAVINGSESREDAPGAKIPEGRRHSALMAQAGSLRYHGAQYADLLSAITDMNRRQCEPPLPQKELEVMAATVASYQPGHYAPRGEEDEETEAVNRNAFTTLFDSAVYDRRLKQADLLTYWIINMHSRKEGQGRGATVSITQIAKEARVSRRAVIVCVDRLVEYGYLEKHKRRAPESKVNMITHYVILPPPEPERG